jgi:hypothetical protein
MKKFTGRGIKNLMMETMKSMKEEGKIDETNISAFAYYSYTLFNTLMYAPDMVVEELNTTGDKITNMLADIMIPDIGDKNNEG